MPSVDGESDSPPIRPAGDQRRSHPMRPKPEETDPWDDLPDGGLDPDQIPFGTDDDEESEPEPGDFHFDRDGRDDE